MRNLLVGVFAVTLIMSPAGAAHLRIQDSPQFTLCAKTAKGMRAMQHCDSREVTFQEGKLNHEFAVALQRHPLERRQLQTQQTTWSDRKDAKCLIFSRRRGSLNSLKAMDCFRHEIISRRRDLASQR